jgi:hypothetical protein
MHPVRSRFVVVGRGGSCFLGGGDGRLGRTAPIICGCTTIGTSYCAFAKVVACLVAHGVSSVVLVIAIFWL